MAPPPAPQLVLHSLKGEEPHRQRSRAAVSRERRCTKPDPRDGQRNRRGRRSVGSAALGPHHRQGVSCLHHRIAAGPSRPGRKDRRIDKCAGQERLLEVGGEDTSARRRHRVTGEHQRPRPDVDRERRPRPQSRHQLGIRRSMPGDPSGRWMGCRTRGGRPRGDWVGPRHGARRSTTGADQSQQSEQKQDRVLGHLPMTPLTAEGFRHDAGVRCAGHHLGGDRRRRPAANTPQLYASKPVWDTSPGLCSVRIERRCSRRPAGWRSSDAEITVHAVDRWWHSRPYYTKVKRRAGSTGCGEARSGRERSWFKPTP